MSYGEVPDLFSCTQILNMKGVKETVSLTYLYQHHLAFRFTFKHMVTFFEKNGKELGRILPSQWRAWP